MRAIHFDPVPSWITIACAICLPLGPSVMRPGGLSALCYGVLVRQGSRHKESSTSLEEGLP